MRTVVEENQFVQDMYELAEQYSGIHAACDAIKWTLSRQPHVGYPVQPNSAYYVFELPPIGNTPPLSILYLYDPVTDDDHVYLHSIWVAG